MASSSFTLPSSLQTMKEEEDKLREQFASQGSSSSYSSYSYSSSSGGSIDDPHVHLIDVYNNPGSFTRQALPADEDQIPSLFPQNDPRSVGSSVIFGESQFKQNWDKFTSGSLKGLDWSNIFVAGGAVLRCLDTWEEVSSDGENKGSDVDLFLYGLSDDQANDKIRKIFETVKGNVPSQKVEIVRTKNAVTIIGDYPLRHVQIILRMYKSPAEVLMGFDIDSCTCGYDGSRVWCLPRFRRAITKRYNLVDLSRRSLTYEIRLFKYSKRGFSVKVPGYRPGDIDSNLYDLSRPIKEVTGLARLLLLAHRGNTSTPNPIRPQEKKLNLRPDGFNDEKILEGKVGGVPAKSEEEDYILVFIPYGPRWYLHRTLKLLNLRDTSQLFAKRQTDPSFQGHVLTVGMDSIFNGPSGVAPPVPSSGKDDYVRGPISWLRDNPGQQTDSNLLTGSFNPLKGDDWEQDALKSYGGSKGVIPPRPQQHIQTYGYKGTKKAPIKKKMVPTPKKKVATAKKKAPRVKATYGGFAPRFSQPSQPAPSSFAPTPASGFGAPASGGFGAPAPAAGGFGAPASGGFAPKPVGLFGAAGSPATGGFSAPASGGFTPTPVGLFGAGSPAAVPSGGGFSGQSQHPELERQYKDAAPKETDTKLFLLLSLLKKGGLLSAAHHSKLKDKVINGDANLVCALEVFEIDYDFSELADTLQLVATL